MTSSLSPSATTSTSSPLPFCVGLSFGTSSLICTLIRPSSLTLPPTTLPPIDILTTTRGDRFTPLVVSLRPPNNRIVGVTAIEQRHTFPTMTISHIKPILHHVNNHRKEGKEQMTSSLKSLLSSLHIDDFTLSVNDQNVIGLHIPSASPPIWTSLSDLLISSFTDISALIKANCNLSSDVILPVVMSVPQEWIEEGTPSPAMEILQSSLEKSSFSLLQFIPDPISIALSHQLDRIQSPSPSPSSLPSPSLSFLLDIGASYTTFSLLQHHGGLMRLVSSKMIFNDFCGDQIDRILCKYFHTEFLKQNPSITAASFPLSFSSPLSHPTYRLLLQSEIIKRVLSSSSSASVELDSLFDGMDFSSKISRLKFYSIPAFMAIIKSLVDNMDSFLTSNGITDGQVDRVILSGGSSRIPKVLDVVKQMNFRQIMVAPTNIASSFNSDEYCAIGATYQCYYYIQRGLNSKKDIAQIVSSSTNVNNAKSVVLSSSVGISDSNNDFVSLFPAFSPLPSTRSLTLSSPSSSDKIKILKFYQGDHPMTSHNTLIGNVSIVSADDTPVDITIQQGEKGKVELFVVTKNGSKLDLSWEGKESDVQIINEEKMGKIRVERETQMKKYLEEKEKLEKIKAEKEEKERIEQEEKKKNEAPASASTDDIVDDLD